MSPAARPPLRGPPPEPTVDHNLAVLIDFDNIAKGARLEGLGEFDIRLVIRRLQDMGRILVARAYCDWERWPRHRMRLAESGVTMVELPATGHGDKNRGDIALVVDAMEMAFTRQYLDTFVILSGDSDFTPLVVRLKELNRRVIGIGTRGSTSRLIANVCDEFMFYDSLVKNAAQVRRHQARPPDDEEDTDDESTGKLRPDVAFNLLVETVHNHQRDDGGPIHASVLKTSMKRKLPTFNETELGFSTFARFLERAAAEGLVALSRDERAGGLRVEPNGGAPVQAPVAPTAPPPSRAEVTTPAEPARGPAPRQQRPIVEALDVLRAEGLDVGMAAERMLILDAFVAGCAAREAEGRRLAVQYLQGDLVQQGLPTDRVRAVLHTLGAAELLMHPDGTPVRSPTAPIQAPPSADELNELVEEKMLEVLGAKRIRVGPIVRSALFVDESTRPARDEREGPNSANAAAALNESPDPGPYGRDDSAAAHGFSEDPGPYSASEPTTSQGLADDPGPSDFPGESEEAGPPPVELAGNADEAETNVPPPTDNDAPPAKPKRPRAPRKPRVKPVKE